MEKMIAFYLFVLQGICIAQQIKPKREEHGFRRISIESRVSGLNLSLLHLPAGDEKMNKLPVLFVHGASFPSALAFGFRMENYSWMDHLSNQGYEVFALDHLGYGESDRYTEMSNAVYSGKPLGTGKEVALDIERAVEFVLKTTEMKKLYLVGHSWGATVSGYYAALHPDQIEKLVLFAPLVAREETVSWNKPDYAYIELTPEKRVEQFSAQLPKGHDIVLEDEVIEQWGQKWLASDKASKVENRNYVRYPAGWKNDLYDCWNGNCFFEPARVEVSTLVIRGEWDTSFSWDDARWLFENLSAAASKKYVVIEKSTHVVHLEKSRKQLYDEVQLFLSEK
ncbi:MAG: alpha/beta fold hydrolase [Reichenbachiella sp.]|uniref:alpha/beta fold hydrolase n=1 Tax=Reichenbachiella sp. TaxID=2184521 RepID=UPI003263280F